MLLTTKIYHCEQLRLLTLRQMLPVGLVSLLSGRKGNPYPDTSFSHNCLNQHPLEGTNRCSEEAGVGRDLLAHSFYHMCFDHKSHCFDRWSIIRYSQANLLGKFGAICWYATCGGTSPPLSLANSNSRCMISNYCRLPRFFSNSVYAI